MFSPCGPGKAGRREDSAGEERWKKMKKGLDAPLCPWYNKMLLWPLAKKEPLYHLVNSVYHVLEEKAIDSRGNVTTQPGVRNWAGADSCAQ